MFDGISWGKTLGYKWFQQILGCENVKGTFNMKNTTAHIPRYPPVSYPHRCTYVGQGAFLHPPSFTPDFALFLALI